MVETETPVNAGMNQLYDLKLTEHTGMLILWQNKVQTITGNYEDCAAYYNKVKVHNLLFGWWSPVSVLANPIVMYMNYAAMKKLKRLAGIA